MKKAKLAKNTREMLKNAWEDGNYYASTKVYDYALSEISEGIIVYRNNGHRMEKLGLL